MITECSRCFVDGTGIKKVTPVSNFVLLVTTQICHNPRSVDTKRDPTMVTTGIILTGATGYLGQHLLHAILSDPLDGIPNVHIYALYQSKVGLEEAVEHVWKTALPTTTSDVPLTPPLTVLGVDITEGSAVDSSIRKIHLAHDRTICIHTAALSSPALCEKDPDLAHRVNNPTLLFDLLGTLKIPVVCLSSDQVYDGNHAPYACPSTLSTPPQPQPTNVYGKTKLAMEQYVQSHHLHAVCLRSSIILGPPVPFLTTTHATFLQFCQQQGDRKEPTDYYVDEKRSVISVFDVISVLRFFVVRLMTATTTAYEVYNMGGPQSISRTDMALAVYDRLHFDRHLIQQSVKAQQPPSSVPAPLDISMDSTPLMKLHSIPFRSLEEIVQETFPP
jgi:dTDP-4-dehydrorhamnose reductase